MPEPRRSGVECKVGIADRAVRVVILSAGLVLAVGLDVLDIAVYVLAALSASSPCSSASGTSAAS